MRLALQMIGMCWALASLSAFAQTTGENGLGHASMLKDVKTIANYYDRIRNKLELEEAKRVPPDISEEDRSGDNAENGGRSTFTMTPPKAKEVVAQLLPEERDIQAGYRDGKRDPFSPTNRLLQVAQVDEGVTHFQPLNTATEMPRMHLRGLVQDKSGDVAALLEIQNSGIHIVREGDTVGLYDMGVNSVIRVRQINRLNMIVEAGSLGQMIIVR